VRTVGAKVANGVKATNVAMGAKVDRRPTSQRKAQPVATTRPAATKKRPASRARARTAPNPRGGKKAAPPQPVIRLVKIKALDPVAKCGPATSVEQLYRVDEQANGQATVHLVFFDRHGWYCVHGPRSAAVADVHSHTRTRAAGR
jgi:hypothetical protein